MAGESVAVIGVSSPVGALLAQLVEARAEFSLALATNATSLEEIAGKAQIYFLVLPRGESRDLGRALTARGALVVDVGGDQRGLAQVPDALGESAAVREGLRGKRLISVPSAGALAAFFAAAPLLEARLLHPERLALLVFAGDELDAAGTPPARGAGASVAAFEHGIAEELGFLLGQRHWPAQRFTCTVVRAPLSNGLLGLVTGELAREEGGSASEVRRALEQAAPSWVRCCTPGEGPETARVLRTGFAEVSAWPDGFAERITAACALDAVHFTALAALRAAELAVGLGPSG